jgi:hypothetical protein
MKQKRSSVKQRSQARDHGKDLFDALMFLFMLLGVLWYLNI